jgi:hypothetical protein
VSPEEINNLNKSLDLGNGTPVPRVPVALLRAISPVSERLYRVSYCRTTSNREVSQKLARVREF